MQISGVFVRKSKARVKLVKRKGATRVRKPKSSPSTTGFTLLRSCCNPKTNISHHHLLLSVIIEVSLSIQIESLLRQEQGIVCRDRMEEGAKEIDGERWTKRRIGGGEKRQRPKMTKDKGVERE